VGDGLRLSAAFFDEVVRPLLEPAIEPYSAGLIGPGSEVLGLDDTRSTDHDWGPRLQVLVSADVTAEEIAVIDALLDQRLPTTFRSWPVRFALSHDPEIRHRVEVGRRGDWFRAHLGFDPLLPITTEQWLTVPTSRLGEVTAGGVWHDGDGSLGRSRAALAWYPDDVWRRLLAEQWRRIAQEESFPGRCAERGDHLGASVVVAGLARTIMRWWLLAARRYPPYAKWLGTAFAAVPGAGPVADELRRAIAATDGPTQERHLGAALVATARRHNELGLSAPCPATLRPFFDRPFLVIGADRFADALLVHLEDGDLAPPP